MHPPPPRPLDASAELGTMPTRPPAWWSGRYPVGLCVLVKVGPPSSDTWIRGNIPGSATRAMEPYRERLPKHKIFVRIPQRGVQLFWCWHVLRMHNRVKQPRYRRMPAQRPRAPRMTAENYERRELANTDSDASTDSIDSESSTECAHHHSDGVDSDSSSDVVAGPVVPPGAATFSGAVGAAASGGSAACGFDGRGAAASGRGAAGGVYRGEAAPFDGVAVHDAAGGVDGGGAAPSCGGAVGGVVGGSATASGRGAAGDIDCGGAVPSGGVDGGGAAGGADGRGAAGGAGCGGAVASRRGMVGSLRIFGAGKRRAESRPPPPLPLLPLPTPSVAGRNDAPRPMGQAPTRPRFRPRRPP